MILNLQEIHDNIWSKDGTIWDYYDPKSKDTASALRYALSEVCGTQTCLIEKECVDDIESKNELIELEHICLGECYTDLVIALGKEHIYTAPYLDIEEGYGKQGDLTPLDLISYLIGMALYDYQVRGTFSHVPWRYYAVHALESIAKYPGFDLLEELREKD